MSTRSVITARTVPTRAAARTTARTATTSAALFPLAHVTHLRRPPIKNNAIADQPRTIAAALMMPTSSPTSLCGWLKRPGKTVSARQLQTPFHPEEPADIRLGGQPTDTLFQDGLDFRSPRAVCRPPQATSSAARRSLRWIMNRRNRRKFELCTALFKNALFKTAPTACVSICRGCQFCRGLFMPAEGYSSRYRAGRKRGVSAAVL
jgi:hypothetical protein